MKTAKEGSVGGIVKKPRQRRRKGVEKKYQKGSKFIVRMKSKL